MRTQTFLNRKTVFDLEEFDEFYSAEKPGKPSSRRALLKYYTKTGRIKQVRKGLYLSVPPGKAASADPYLICSKLVPDAVLAYHTALQFHGKAYTIQNDYLCLSKSRIQPFHYAGQIFRTVLFPKNLLITGNERFGVEEVDWQGESVSVTTLERTMVDVLQRPDLSGGWEEVWRSLEMVEYFDLDTVSVYVELLANATTAVKVGYFLEQHREELMVDQDVLDRIRALKPKSPHYMDRSYKGGAVFAADWNLVVPDFVAEKRWEEQ